MILEGLHEKEIFSENYSFRLVVNTSLDFHYPLHWHNAVELVYNLESCCKVNVGGIEYLLDGRDVLVIPSGEIHDIHTLSSSGKRFFIQFDVSMLDGFGGISNVRPFLSRTEKISCHSDGCLHSALEKCIMMIIEEYEKKEFAYTLSLNARVYDIIVLLSRNMISKTGMESFTGSSKKVSGLEKINNAYKYIEENYQHDMTLKDVSKAVGFSEYHFSRIFKEITGKNFHSYLNEFRIKKAERLLMNSSLPVSLVALEVGFNSFATFNRIFKNIKGCAPTFFKKAGV